MICCVETDMGVTSPWQRLAGKRRYLIRSDSGSEALQRLSNAVQTPESKPSPGQMTEAFGRYLAALARTE